MKLYVFQATRHAVNQNAVSNETHDDITDDDDVPLIDTAPKQGNILHKCHVLPVEIQSHLIFDPLETIFHMIFEFLLFMASSYIDGLKNK